MSFLELFVASFRGRKLKAMETMLLAFLSALLFFSLIFAFSSGDSKAPAKASTAPVVIKVGYGDVTSSISQAGKVVTEGTAYVSPKTPSRLTNLYVRVGSQVSQGTVLATMENTNETQALAQANVALNVAVTQLNNALANIKALQDVAATNYLTYQSAVNSASRILESTKAQLALKNQNYQNAVDQAQVSFNQAQSIYNSYAQLVGPAINLEMCKSYNTVNANCTQLMQNYVSYQNTQIALTTATQNQSLNKQIDDIQIANLSATYQSALLQQTSGQQKDQQAVAAAQRAYATLATQFGVSKADPKPEDFVLAQLAIASAQQALDATFVRAPISGVITSVGASLGQNAPNGAYNAESLFTITSRGSYQLQADFNLVDGLKIYTGQIATVTFVGITNPVRAAKIVSILKMPPNENVPPSYRATIQITGESNDIYPGLAGTAEVAIRGVSHVLIVPNMAIIVKAGKSYVKKINPKDGKPVLTYVKIGLVGKSTSQVISGLAFGDSIQMQKDSNPIKKSA